MSLLRGARGPRKAVLLGATSGMGRALARLLASRGDRVFVLGHEPDELERSAADLSGRAGGASVGRAICDLERPETFASALDAADDALGGFVPSSRRTSESGSPRRYSIAMKYASPARPKSKTVHTWGCWIREAMRASSRNMWTKAFSRAR